VRGIQDILSFTQKDRVTSMRYSGLNLWKNYSIGYIGSKKPQNSKNMSRTLVLGIQRRSQHFTSWITKSHE
jgi:hypothetical protein